eukprot:COSAG01_NODE_2112_length_8403_cov_15.894027_1_plen_136_part_10
MERDLTALLQWARAYNDATPGAADYAHVKLNDGCFESVTVVYEYSLELVTRKGLRVFAMDACHYVGVADDALRMLVLEGYLGLLIRRVRERYCNQSVVTSDLYKVRLQGMSRVPPGVTDYFGRVVRNQLVRRNARA